MVKRRTGHGYTLIELLIVVAILGILLVPLSVYEIGSERRFWTRRDRFLVHTAAMNEIERVRSLAEADYQELRSGPPISRNVTRPFRGTVVTSIRYLPIEQVDLIEVEVSYTDRTLFSRTYELEGIR